MYIWKIEAVQNRGRRIRSVVLLVVLTFFLFLHNWIAETVPQAHILPNVERIDISILLERAEHTEAELQILSAQTGLHPQSIQKLLDQGRGQELFLIQQQYFAPIQLKSLHSTPLTISEVLVDEGGGICYGMPLVDVQEGDILLTKNSRFLGWRNGHAALVVDADKGLLLEAIMPGTDSKISPISKWSTYPSFLVLRLKEEYRNKADLSKQIAAYAERQLVDVPYLLVAGILERSLPESMTTVKAAGQNAEQATMKEKALKGTQCAHLVWYAYKQFGIDLDSDSGVIVTPFDIQNSEYLDIIQTYGY
ncbi:MAG: hypothetical protein IKK33_04060 [Lachnospiraceae bacterium]|nr:hypothetical protein [Lachnospiraceae bacterium]